MYVWKNRKQIIMQRTFTKQSQHRFGNKYIALFRPNASQWFEMKLQLGYLLFRLEWE